MHMLEFFKGNKTDLDKLATQIEALNQADYSEVSWNVMLPVLNEAKSVLDDENAMQEEVNEAYTKLIKAFLELRLKPNKDLLASLIKEVEALNKANYTEASWQAVMKTLENGKAVLANEEAGYAAVEEAIANLQESINGLKGKVEVPVNPGGKDDVKGSTVKTGDSRNMNQLAAVVLLAGAAVTLLKRKKIDE